MAGRSKASRTTPLLRSFPKGRSTWEPFPNGRQKGLKWTTKYGVVGMNACGLPLFIDGINDQGLTAGNLFFPGYAAYQPFDPQQADKTVAQYEALTYILSNFATVAEVKEGIKKHPRVPGKLRSDRRPAAALHHPRPAG